MRTILTLAASALITLLAGCSCVFVRHPFPPSIPPVDKDRLEGSWQMGEGYISVAFDSKGLGHAAFMEWKEDHFETEEFAFTTATGRYSHYMCIGVPTNGTQARDESVLARYVFLGSNHVRIFMAQRTAFETAVSNRVLSGIIDRGTNTEEKLKSLKVIVTDSPERLIRVLDGPAHKDLFADSDPILLRRVPMGK